MILFLVLYMFLPDKSFISPTISFIYSVRSFILLHLLNQVLETKSKSKSISKSKSVNKNAKPHGPDDLFLLEQVQIGNWEDYKLQLALVCNGKLGPVLALKNDTSPE